MQKTIEKTRESDDLCPAENEEEEAQPQGESEEVREMQAPRIPVAPSREEVLQHRLTHRPYRSWCPHCVRGKGCADAHRESSQKHEIPGIPKIVSDYFFVGRRRPAGRSEREIEENAAEQDG